MENNVSELRCVIVDDDPVSLLVLESLITKTSGLKLASKFENGIDALNYLKNNQVEVLFADVEMPGFSGFELIQLLFQPPAIIIMSGNPNNAVRAFDFPVNDFLVKPLDNYGRFLKAIDVVRERLLEKRPNREQIFIKVDSGFHRLVFDEITFISADGDYIKIALKGQQKALMVLTTLKAFEENLPRDKFFRTHRSFIVNLMFVQRINASGVVIGDSTIPLSEPNRARLLEVIKLI